MLESYGSLLKVSSREADAAMSLKTWWALLFIYPLAKEFTAYIVNNTRISANQITLSAIFLRIVAIICFFNGQRWAIIVGAVSYYFAYLFDCVDGPVARLTGKTTEFGRYFDHVSDLVGDLLILCALTYGQGIFGRPVVLAMMFAHVTEYYVSFLTSNIISTRTDEELKNVNIVFTFINRYRSFFFRRNFKSFLSFPDYEAVVFIIFPLIGNATLGIRVGFYLLLVIVSYTIFSSFVTIMTSGDKFP